MRVQEGAFPRAKEQHYPSQQREQFTASSHAMHRGQGKAEATERELGLSNRRTER